VAALCLGDVRYRTDPRFDDWEFDAAAVEVDDHDPQSRTARCGGMRNCAGNADGRHLCRLAGQQVIAEAHLPTPVLKTNHELLKNIYRRIPRR
jgi:hypothetical protein